MKAVLHGVKQSVSHRYGSGNSCARLVSCFISYISRSESKPCCWWSHEREILPSVLVWVFIRLHHLSWSQWTPNTHNTDFLFWSHAHSCDRKSNRKSESVLEMIWTLFSVTSDSCLHALTEWNEPKTRYYWVCLTYRYKSPVPWYSKTSHGNTVMVRIGKYDQRRLGK